MTNPPARGRRVELPHVGALDGLRGLAVVAVILYHAGVSWLPGGFLGVELFFVLSGYLITSLLLAEWLERGTIALPAFWARRARRLLPALVVLVIVVGLYYALDGNAQAVPGLLGDGLAALLYYSNWHQVAVGTNYFVASGPVSPFQHTWSLAIEEQFYALWPLIVLGSVSLVRSRRGSSAASLRALLGVALIGVAASALMCLLEFAGGAGIDRVYYGTDTRASGLLAGAALAIWLALRRSEGRAAINRRAGLSVAAVAGLALVFAAIRLANSSSAWLFPWGLLAVDAATVTVIAAAVLAPGTLASRLLSVAPLRATGRISYGLYLWHFPLFLWLDTGTTGLSGLSLLAVRVAVTVGVSIVSYVFVEQPIRQRRRPGWLIGSLAPVGAAAAIGSLLAASAATALPAAPAAIASVASASLAGDGPACTVSLTDTPGLGIAPGPLKSEQSFEYDALGDHSLTWSGSATRTFETCPPKRLLVIGDSIAFTIGLPMLQNEQHYGVEVADGAILGCAFSTRGQLDVDGVWQAPDDGCPDALQTWAADERQFHPAEVVIELGYRDEFDWRWNGQVVHLGEPAFDAYLQSQIDDYVKVLGTGGTRILFLTVPYVNPPAQSDGAPAPAASASRHALINGMLAKAAKLDPGRAAVLDVDKTLSPQGHYTTDVDGQVCRFDGIHISLFCAGLLEGQILPAARSLLDH